MCGVTSQSVSQSVSPRSLRESPAPEECVLPSLTLCGLGHRLWRATSSFRGDGRARSLLAPTPEAAAPHHRQRSTQQQARLTWRRPAHAAGGGNAPSGPFLLAPSRAGRPLVPLSWERAPPFPHLPTLSGEGDLHLSLNVLRRVAHDPTLHEACLAAAAHRAAKAGTLPARASQPATRFQNRTQSSPQSRPLYIINSQRPPNPVLRSANDLLTTFT